ncbi:MAG: serine hydrolase domain-containing protein [Gemmatimonadales bacterium]|jgi:CubicO group peptidase (beta-lactamase class C family)
MKYLQPAAAFVLASLAAACTASTPDPVSERRQQVENSLMLAVSFEGEEPHRSLAEEMRRYDVPGVSFAVIDDGEIDWAAGYGLRAAGSSDTVTTNTLFQAASIAKPLTAVAALRMQDAGLIDIDVDVQEYLEDFVIPEGEQSESNPVTLRRLLSHTAGITPGGYLGYAKGEPLPTDLETLTGSPPANTAPARVVMEPGSAVAYSGGGYTIVELALQDVTGLPFARLMDAWVLSVIGLERSTYSQPLDEAREDSAALGHLADGTTVPGGWRVHPEQAAAGLWTTASDLATFAIELRNAYLGASDLLSPGTAAEMLTEQLDGEGIGLIVSGEGETLHFSHAGGNVGYRANMIMYVASGDGAVYLTNSDRGQSVGRELLRAASSVYDWPGFKSREATRVALDSTTLIGLQGTYDFGDDIRVVIAFDETAGGLTITFPNGDVYGLVPIGPFNFVHPETGVTVDFDGTDERRTVVVYGDTGVRVRN